MPRGRFTEEEKGRARQKWGMSKECPRCGGHGNIDEAFGWRRMKPGDTEISPQAQCYACRGRSWKK
jgi:hypothetical protein